MSLKGCIFDEFLALTINADHRSDDVGCFLCLQVAQEIHFKGEHNKDCKTSCNNFYINDREEEEEKQVEC